MATQEMDSDTPMFSTETIQRLRSAGWNPERQVDVAIYAAAFHDEGLHLPSEVRSFLNRFGGLIIPYTTRANQEDTLDFLAHEAVQGLGGGALRGYEEMVGIDGLSPIGHFASGAVLLMMAPSGDVYAGSDWKLVYLGQNGAQAIENIISGPNPPVPLSGAPERILRATIDADKLQALEFQDYFYSEHLSGYDVCEV